MSEPPATLDISSTHHFKRQLANFCRLERVPPNETRRLDRTIAERVGLAHGGNVIFSPGGCKVPVSFRLENGETAKMLIVFDETLPGSRTILKIHSARIVRRGQE